MTRLVWWIAAALVAGCNAAPPRHSDVPLPANSPVSTQRELQAADHWQLTAASIAATTSGMIRDNPQAAAQRYRIESPLDDTPFARAFHALLVTELVRAGVSVAPGGPDAIPIAYQLQLLEFGPDRRTGYPLYRSAQSYPPALRIEDPAQIRGTRAPRHELIVTVSIERDGAYWLRRSDIYYLRDADAALYLPAAQQTRPRLVDLIRSHEAARLEAEGWPDYAIPH
jgi:hypothetical protein